jgi:hypothetical protein
MIETQSSQLLPALFEYIDEDRRLTVLHLGPALPETVEFFSRYRSKLFFADLFAELPLVAEEEGELSLEQQLAASLELPADIRFDLCLFWDLFNFLDGPAIAALQAILRPHVHPSTLGHGFTSHKPRHGYAARGQGPLKNALDRFEFGRTVLLPDKRLEFLLSVKRWRVS